MPTITRAEWLAELEKANALVSPIIFRTPQQTKWHKAPQKNCASIYKGVCRRKDIDKWRAQIGHDHKRMTIGCFDNEKDAARAYDEAAKKLWGEHALTNQEYFGDL